MKEPYGEGVGAAMLAAVLAGGSPAGATCPVATVVISGGGKGDRPVESPEVKALGWLGERPGQCATTAQRGDRDVKERSIRSGLAAQGMRDGPSEPAGRAGSKPP